MASAKRSNSRHPRDPEKGYLRLVWYPRKSDGLFIRAGYFFDGRCRATKAVMMATTSRAKVTSKNVFMA